MDKLSSLETITHRCISDYTCIYVFLHAVLVLNVRHLNSCHPIWLIYWCKKSTFAQAGSLIYVNKAWFLIKNLVKNLIKQNLCKEGKKNIWNINSNILLLKYPSLQRLVGNVCRLHARAGSLLKSTVVDKWNTLARPNPYAPQVQLVFKSIMPEDICDHKDSKFGWIWNSSNLLLLNSSLLLSQFDNKVKSIKNP